MRWTMTSRRARVRRSPGSIRDAIVEFLRKQGTDVDIGEIYEAVEQKLGPVARSSVRSYLNLNPDQFERRGRGRYRLRVPG